MRLLTTGEVARELGVSRAAVLSWVRDGKLTPTLTTLGGTTDSISMTSGANSVSNASEATTSSVAVRGRRRPARLAPRRVRDDVRDYALDHLGDPVSGNDCVLG